MNPDTIHVASFSPVQGAWHIETLREHVESNLNCLAQGVLKDTAYCAIMLAENRDDASKAIETRGRGQSERERKWGRGAINADAFHVASFSPVQGAWHVETLREHVESNLRCYAQGVLKDTAYCAVLLAASSDEASRAIDKIRLIMERGEQHETKQPLCGTQRWIAQARGLRVKDAAGKWHTVKDADSCDEDHDAKQALCGNPRWFAKARGVQVKDAAGKWHTVKDADSCKEDAA